MRILGSLLFAILIYAANLEVYLEKNPIYLGEEARLVIKAEGSDIELPKIDEIAGYEVNSKSLSESVIIKNGTMVVTKELYLTFYPDNNVTISPIEVKIDGERLKSEPIELVVKKGKSKDRYVEFSLNVDKNESFVGEPIILDMELKIKRSLNIINYDFIPPKFDGFWVKELKSTNKYLEERGEFLIKRVKFLLLPQKSGVLTISPAVFKYALSNSTTDVFGFNISAPMWKSVVSNEIRVAVKPLPKDVDLVGEFNLSVSVDKNRTKPNEPVNLMVRLAGEGSLENIDSLKPDIDGATVYEDKPKVVEKVLNDKLISIYEQKFSIISDRNFTIEPFEIEYFSPKEGGIKLLKSKPIKIEVVGGNIYSIQSKEKLEEKNEANISATQIKQQNNFGLIYFIAGFILGVLAAFLYGVLKNKKLKKFTIRGDKELLNRLIPYLSSSKEAQKVAEELYKQIYEGKKSKIRKKDVEELIKRL
jgi:hypothetical protein